MMQIICEWFPVRIKSFVTNIIVVKKETGIGKGDLITR